MARLSVAEYAWLVFVTFVIQKLYKGLVGPKKNSVCVCVSTRCRSAVGAEKVSVE
jgi:hypothetical protein